MADAKLAKAKKVYKNMVRALKAKNWHFIEKEEKLRIVSNYKGDDLPVNFAITIDADKEVIQYLSPLPFKIDKAKRVDAAVAVCVANYGLVNGSFDMDISDGEIRYRLTTSFCDCDLGKDFFYDMMATAVLTTDKYNDWFKKLNDGTMTLQQFIEKRKL